MTISGLDVVSAIVERRSIRRFLDRPVSLDTVRAILSQAARAPSATNSQPWLVHVVSGDTRRRISEAVLAATDVELVKQPYYPYFPTDAGEPYQSRRAEFGIAMTELDGFNRRDPEGLRQALRMNYLFFGAPVGLFFCLERKMLYGSWVDVGMFMQNVMLLARGHGLDTCAQVSWTNYGAILHKELSLPDDRVIVAGMSLGFADPEAKPNDLRTKRATIDEFATFHS
ncbi:MAG TPA: nitroreductase [Hyphomicrobiaceae bacterium]|nr:nitroreductase [Hyphomicrobiaceae bacterium]